MRNKIILLILTCIILINYGCNKESDTFKLYESEAVIAGYDMYSGSCEKGFVINIQNDSRYTQALFSDSMPNNQISDASLFPMKVYLNWDLDTSSACVNRILIKKIVKAE